MSPPSPDPELIALLAAQFLGRDERRLAGLFSLSGMNVDDAKHALARREPGFLGHILTYLCSDERWAQAFAQEHDVSPEALHAALKAFGSGQMMD